MKSLLKLVHAVSERQAKCQERGEVFGTGSNFMQIPELAHIKAQEVFHYDN
jgi:hypothetical protein